MTVLNASPRLERCMSDSQFVIDVFSQERCADRDGPLLAKTLSEIKRDGLTCTFSGVLPPGVYTLCKCMYLAPDLPAAHIFAHT